MKEKEYLFLTAQFQLLSVRIWCIAYQCNTGPAPHKILIKYREKWWLCSGELGRQKFGQMIKVNITRSGTGRRVASECDVLKTAQHLSSNFPAKNAWPVSKETSDWSKWRVILVNEKSVSLRLSSTQSQGKEGLFQTEGEQWDDGCSWRGMRKETFRQLEKFEWGQWIRSWCCVDVDFQFGTVVWWFHNRVFLFCESRHGVFRSHESWCWKKRLSLYTHTHKHIHIHIYVYVCICIRMYIYTVCIYIYTHTCK